MLELYGEGLERIVRRPRRGARGRGDGLARDGVVACLLLIHGLYPVPIAERVQAALESVRPYMESHGGGVELVGLEDGVAHLRLHGSCDGCPASASTLELAIREALEEAAPDLDGIEVEGVVEAERATPVPLSGDGRPGPGAAASGRMGGAGRRRRARGRRADGRPRWASSRSSSRTSAARCSPTGTPAPAAGRRSIAPSWTAVCSPAPAAGGASSCRSRAGRSGEDLQLAPVPLLEDDGRVRVAVA